MTAMVVVGGKKVPLSIKAQLIANRMEIHPDKLGVLLEQSPRIARQNGNLTRISVDDVRSVAEGERQLRAPQKYFIGKILRLTLKEGWYAKEHVRQLEARTDDALFILPDKEQKQPPFVGSVFDFSITKVIAPEKEAGLYVVFVKFYRISRATTEEIAEAKGGG